MSETQLHRGLALGALFGGGLIGLLLIGLVPTNEFRARLWFLLGLRSPHWWDPGLEVLFGALIVVLGILALAIARKLDRWALLGLCLAAFLHAVVLVGGGWKWVPEFSAAGTRVLTSLSVLGLTGWGLKRALGIGAL